MFIWTGRYPNAEVEILPLDVMSDEEILREAVKKAESFFSSAGVYYMVHNAGDDPPVCILNFFPLLSFRELCSKFKSLSA